MPRILFHLCIAAGLLVACADFPDLDSYISDGAHDAAYPSLVPTDALYANTKIDPEQAHAISARLRARAADLQRRARALRGPVIERAAMARLVRALRDNERRHN